MNKSMINYNKQKAVLLIINKTISNAPKYR